MKVSERTYRLYNWARCAQQVLICRQCDRGNRVLRGGVRGDPPARLRRAGRCYQGSYRGPCRHAARERAWRERRTQEVTHHGSLSGAVWVAGAGNPTQTTIEQGTHIGIAAVEPRTQGQLAVTLELAEPAGTLICRTIISVYCVYTMPKIRAAL